MIRLTKTNGDSVYINPEHIRAVTFEMKSPFSGSREYSTKVYDGEGNTCWWVKETPEEVVVKIMDYRLAMIRYSILYPETVQLFDKNELHLGNIAELNCLAGLIKEKSTAGTVE